MKQKVELEEILRNSFWTVFSSQFILSGIELSNQIQTFTENPKRIIGGAITFLASSYLILSQYPSSDKISTNKNYSLIRHPIYTGFRLSSLGLIIINPSIENIILGGLVWGTTEITAIEEEKIQIKKHPKKYFEYMKKVPRWIPYSNKIKELFE